MAAAAAVAAPNLKPPPPKAPPLDGDWESVLNDGERKGGGRPVVVTFGPDGKLKMDDGRSAPDWGWYKVDAAKDPPQIDFKIPDVAGPAAERKPWLGVYKVDGDTLTIYFAVGTRPAGLAAPEGSDVTRLSYRRVKKD
jgi:uncharacterized protein (TIGR03067 family)